MAFCRRSHVRELVREFPLSRVVRLIGFAELWMDLGEALGRDPTVKEFCAAFGVHRATVYRWLVAWREVFGERPVGFYA